MTAISLRARTQSLDVTYEETGQADGQAVVLLHRFPYDVRQFDDEAPVEFAQAIRDIVELTAKG